jgi:hypothetical protein
MRVNSGEYTCAAASRFDKKAGVRLLRIGHSRTARLPKQI